MQSNKASNEQRTEITTKKKKNPLCRGCIEEDQAKILTFSTVA